MSKINKKLLYLDDIFPIGKTEIFFDNNDHSNYMGFTWQRTAVGKAIVGIDSNDTDFNTIGKTGGSKYLQEHTHNVSRSGFWGTDNYQNLLNRYCLSADNLPGDPAKYLDVSTAGTGNSGNLQPYEVFAIWVRTA